jgi:hypothetical protein
VIPADRLLAAAPGRAASSVPGTTGGTLAELLAGAGAALLVGSRDPNAKLTAVVPTGGRRDTAVRIAVKVPTTRVAADVVVAEGSLLDALQHRLPAGLAATLPRLVGYVDADGLPAMVTTGLAGVPMLVRYHRWRHTARRSRVAADFAAAASWLARLQDATAGPREPVVLPRSALREIERRFPAHPAVDGVHIGLSPVVSRLAAVRTPRTVVHGDFWLGNLLLHDGQVRGVVDWEAGALVGEPLRDVVRFVLSYALYLDRHTRSGRQVAGHRGLRAGRFGAGVAAALSGRGWFAALVEDFVATALVRLGGPAGAWRDALIAGIAEVAATADHPEFAAGHLELLAELLDGRPSAAGRDAPVPVSRGAVPPDGRR